MGFSLNQSSFTTLDIQKLIVAVGSGPRALRLSGGVENLVEEFLINRLVRGTHLVLFQNKSLGYTTLPSSNILFDPQLSFDNFRTARKRNINTSGVLPSYTYSLPLPKNLFKT